MVIQYALHVQGSGGAGPPPPPAAAAAPPARGGTLHKFTINKKMAAQEAVVPLVEAMHEKVRGILATIVVPAMAAAAETAVIPSLVPHPQIIHSV